MSFLKKSLKLGGGGGDCPAQPSLNDASAWSTDRFLRIAPRLNMKHPSQYLTFRCGTHLALLVRPLLLMYYNFFSFLFHRSADASSILELWESLELPCPPRLLEVSLESQILLSLFLCVRPPPSLFPPPPFRVKSIFPSFPPFIGSPDPSRRRGR